MLYIAAEQDHSEESLWEAYLEVMADPGHLLAELTFVLLLDVLLLGLVVPFLHRLLKRRLERLHAELDEEHNVDHQQAVLSAGSRGVEGRRAPTTAEIERMRAEGVNEWVIALVVDRYGTEQPG